MTPRRDGLTLVPILRSGVLAQQFCARVTQARIEVVFARSLHLRAGDDFICIGGADIGSGPFTLTANLGALSEPDLQPGRAVSVCDRHITIGNTVRFTLDRSEPWRAPAWPVCPPPTRLIDTAAMLARRAAIAAPEEGLARHLPGMSETSGRSLLARVARTRIANFASGLSDVLEAGHETATAFGDSVRGLIGLGPGLTPSGDDFLSGALATLDATGERDAHAALARAISEALPGSTSAFSACFLRAVAVGHVGEHLHRVVASVMTGDFDGALAPAGTIGHSSGWDMLAGVTSTLRIVAVTRLTMFVDAFSAPNRNPLRRKTLRHAAAS